jgi:nuclear pore complex protein Nup210
LIELFSPVNEYEIIRASAQAERSSRRLRDNPITVANGRTIRISAAGISASGKAFANSSSLSLKWELGCCEGLAQWDYAFDIVKSSDWERFLVLQNESGLVLRDLIPNNRHFIYYLTFSLNFTVSGILVVCENLLSQIVVYFYFPL